MDNVDMDFVCVFELGTFHKQYVVRSHEMHSSIFHSLWCWEVFLGAEPLTAAALQSDVNH